MLKLLQAMQLFRCLGIGQLLKIIVGLSLVLAFVGATVMIAFPDAVLSAVETGVLTHGSIDDINAFRALREGR